MSGTRSPFQKAPATKGHAVIVSHGQPSDPGPAEAVLANFARQVAAVLPGWQVESATLAAPGALDRALKAVGPAPLIYPLFMTQGWFTGDALLERLDDQHARVLAPFGTDPGLPEMAARSLQATLRDTGWQAEETRLFIAAHGSGRSRNSARDTQRFARALAQLIHFNDLRVGFVEEAPFLADMAFDLGEKSICLPFFAAKGGHVIDDIPEALALAAFEGLVLEPIGCWEAAPALVARALQTEITAKVPA